MQEAKKNLGKVVRAARKRKKMTQEYLAERAGVQSRLILDMEKGEGNPRFDSLFATVRQLDIPADDIFYYDRAISGDAEKFLRELSAFSEPEQRLALAAARAVLQQIRNDCSHVDDHQ